MTIQSIYINNQGQYYGGGGSLIETDLSYNDANGDFGISTAGAGVVTDPTTASGAAASPVVLNARVGAVTFTSVSIAGNADLTLTMTNSYVSGSSAQIMYSIQGATTGSALSVKSVTPSAGSVAFVITNGTGLTTSTANITINFWVMN